MRNSRIFRTRTRLRAASAAGPAAAGPSTRGHPENRALLGWSGLLRLRQPRGSVTSVLLSHLTCLGLWRNDWPFVFCRDCRVALWQRKLGRGGRRFGASPLILHHGGIAEASPTAERRHAQ